MQLNKLIVKKTSPKSEIIRELKFKNGLNFVIDNSQSKTKTGNNIGKSTVAVIIDLCFSDKPASIIYRDNDIKSDNTTIKNLLSQSKVVAELYFSHQEKCYKIERELFPNGKIYLDGEKMIRNDFEKKLKEIIFNSNADFPTFAQLMNIFIRVNESTESKLFRVLNKYAPNWVYDNIYSFLFQLTPECILNKKNNLNETYDDLIRTQKALEKDSSLKSIAELEQEESLLAKYISELEKKRDLYRTKDDYINAVNLLNDLNLKLNNYQSKFDTQKFEYDLLEQSIKQLVQDKSNINPKAINELYNEANILIKELNVSFEELVSFHNEMIENKIKFLQSRIDDKKMILSQLDIEIKNLLERKSKLMIDSYDEDLFQKSEQINNQIKILSERKGKANESLRILSENITKIKNIRNEINNLNLQNNETLIKNNMLDFNSIFGNLTEQAYGERQYIAYEPYNRDKNNFPIKINGLGKAGTGMKKCYIALFNFAYAIFAKNKNINIPRFFVYDKLETMDSKQIKLLFDVAEQNEIQAVIPVLREKISTLGETAIETHELLSLNEHDKFFKV